MRPPLAEGVVHDCRNAAGIGVAPPEYREDPQKRGSGQRTSDPDERGIAADLLDRQPR